MAKTKSPNVFLEVSIDGSAPGLLEFELFYDVVPKTAENFRALCTGEKGIGAVTHKPLHYKGSYFHRIIKGFVAQGGDFSKRDGRGGESIYGGKFTDEGFTIKHDSPGLLSMANAGPNSNGSQFFITFKATPHLDGKHVVFGKLIHGHEVLKDMELVDTDDTKPVVPVKIVNCGEVRSSKSESLIPEKEKRKSSRQKTTVNDSSNDGSRETRRKSKHKKSSRLKKKKKKRYYSSDTESSSLDSDTESSESDSDSDSYSSSSSSELSSSSDDHRRRKRHYKRDRYKRSKKKEREKKREEASKT